MVRSIKVILCFNSVTLHLLHRQLEDASSENAKSRSVSNTFWAISNPLHPPLFQPPKRQPVPQAFGKLQEVQLSGLPFRSTQSTSHFMAWGFPITVKLDVYGSKHSLKCKGVSPRSLLWLMGMRVNVSPITLQEYSSEISNRPMDEGLIAPKSVNLITQSNNVFFCFPVFFSPLLSYSLRPTCKTLSQALLCEKHIYCKAKHYTHNYFFFRIIIVSSLILKFHVYGVLLNERMSGGTLTGPHNPVLLLTT